MTILGLHAAATLAMTGLIWFVQVVHYPLFELASERRFRTFAAEHQRRTALVVVPLMLTEAITAILLLLRSSTADEARLLWIGAALLLAIWVSTAFLQVPLHRHLERGADSAAVARLVRTNWIRTVAWTARSWLVLSLVRLARD